MDNLDPAVVNMTAAVTVLALALVHRRTRGWLEFVWLLLRAVPPARTVRHWLYRFDAVLWLDSKIGWYRARRRGSASLR